MTDTELHRILEESAYHAWQHRDAREWCEALRVTLARIVVAADDGGDLETEIAVARELLATVPTEL